MKMDNYRHRRSVDTPIYFTFVNLILDSVIVHVRVFLLPFKLLTQLFQWISMIAWLLSNEYTKRKLKACGKGVRIHGRFLVTAPENLWIGNNVHINSNAFIRAEGGLYIEDNVHISRNIVVYTMNHDYEGDLLPYNADQVMKPVRIERNVWIGIGVHITPGVTIGEGAIIGMGTVVAKDVPPLSIVGGSPQQVIKMRDADHYKSLDNKHLYGGMSGYRWRGVSGQ